MKSLFFYNSLFLNSFLKKYSKLKEVSQKSKIIFFILLLKINYIIVNILLL